MTRIHPCASLIPYSYQKKTVKITPLFPFYSTNMSLVQMTTSHIWHHSFGFGHSFKRRLTKTKIHIFAGRKFLYSPKSWEKSYTPKPKRKRNLISMSFVKESKYLFSPIHFILKELWSQEWCVPQSVKFLDHHIHYIPPWIWYHPATFSLNFP